MDDTTAPPPRSETSSLTGDLAEVRMVYDRNGRRHVGWVLNEITWLGRERWRGQVEREFVDWSIQWKSRRFRSRDDAVKSVHRVLDRIEAHKNWEPI